MDRLISSGYREGITVVQRRMPVNIWHRLRHVQFICGLDPKFLGCHQWPLAFTVGASTAYRYHTSDKSTTVTINRVDNDPWMAPNLPYVVAHEYGHALHETLGFAPSAGAVSAYGRTSPHEAFAEAFAAWMGFWRNGEPFDFSPDVVTAALFRTLATVGT